MIVSRMAELARLDALLAALVRGEGGALVVHGEAGIGKTTLLEALPVIAAACRRAGTDAGQLADAEASGLVRLGAGLVTFAHPLIRGLVYSEAGAAARRAAHAALAAVLRDDDDRQAWHLAAAAIGPD